MSRAALCLFVLAGLCCVGPAFAADTVYYYHTDAQGTAVVVTDANHNVVERTYYGPYGEVLNRSLRDGPGYTGHEEDAATGLDNMQQRYYDPVTGRFPSTDPMEVDTTTGSNFNRYAYAADNPYRYVDPDGRGNLSSEVQEKRHKDWERNNEGSLVAKMPGVSAFLQGASALGSGPEMAGRAGLELSYNTVGGAPNTKSWSINWQLSNPAPQNGYVIQQVHDTEKVSGRPQASVTFFEAWRIHKGRTSTDSSRNTSVADDCFCFSSPGPRHTSVTTVTATARFYGVNQLPPSFRDGNVPYAGLPGSGVLSSWSAPNLPLDSATPPVTRTDTFTSGQ